MKKAKSDVVIVSIRFPRQIHEKLVAQAEKDTRSLSQQVVHYVRQALEGELWREEVMNKKYEEKEKKIQRGDG